MNRSPQNLPHARRSSPFRRACRVAPALLALSPFLFGAPVAPAPPGRIPFADSIKEVPVGAPASRPHRVREKLRSDEAAQSMGIVVSLRMRDLAGLQARLQSGETVPK